MTEGYEDTTQSAADIMTAKDSHGCIVERYRPMRGQAYVQMTDKRSAIILDPFEDKEEKAVQRGRVIDLGPPARLTDHPDSPIVPWDCKVGDAIVFRPFVWLDKMRTMRVFGVTGVVMVVAQDEIEGVIE